MGFCFSLEKYNITWTSKKNIICRYLCKYIYIYTYCRAKEDLAANSSSSNTNAHSSVSTTGAAHHVQASSGNGERFEGGSLHLSSSEMQTLGMKYRYYAHECRYVSFVSAVHSWKVVTSKRLKYSIDSHMSPWHMDIWRVRACVFLPSFLHLSWLSVDL